MGVEKDGLADAALDDLPRDAFEGLGRGDQRAFDVKDSALLNHDQRFEYVQQRGQLVGAAIVVKKEEVLTAAEAVPLLLGASPRQRPSWKACATASRRSRLAVDGPACSENALAQDLYAHLLRRLAQRAIQRGQWQLTPHRQFKVECVVAGQLSSAA